MSWIVLRRFATQRANVDGSGRTEFAWEPEPGLPAYASHLDAIRAVVAFMCGVTPGTSDALVREHWRRYQRNVGHHKVEKSGKGQP